MLICKYCNKECKNKKSYVNHERLCPKNKDRVYKNGMSGKKGSNQYTKAKENNLPIPEYDRSAWKIGGCCAWTTTERSVAAKEQGFGGYRSNAGRSKKFKVIDSFGNCVTLQSTYELECSKILDALDIKWIRPKCLPYDNRRYFADFYLPDVDIWLDPKNNYKAKQDKEKIRKVIEQNKVRLYVLLEHQLTVEYIKMLCS